MDEPKASLHRKRPGQEYAKELDEAPRSEILRQFLNKAPSTREQYSMMEGSMIYNHLEMEAMARDAGLIGED